MRAKESGLRTNRANRCRRVLFQRSSTRRFSCFLPDRHMLPFWNHRLISTPKIGVTQSGTVCVRNGFPQTAAGLFTSISHCIRNHLSCLSTQGYPDPRLIRLLQHKRPQFIQFQHRHLFILGIRREQRFAQGWQLCGLFLSRRSPRFVTLAISPLESPQTASLFISSQNLFSAFF
jgi:hypothetical protein